MPCVHRAHLLGLFHGVGEDGCIALLAARSGAVHVVAGVAAAVVCAVAGAVGKAAAAIIGIMILSQ